MGFASIWASRRITLISELTIIATVPRIAATHLLDNDILNREQEFTGDHGGHRLQQVVSVIRPLKL